MLCLAARRGQAGLSFLLGRDLEKNIVDKIREAGRGYNVKLKKLVKIATPFTVQNKAATELCTGINLGK